MPPRRAFGGGEEEMAVASSSSIDSQLAQLNKANAKMERMLIKIGTPADNSEFRDHLSAERKAATTLTKSLLTQLKAQGARPGASANVKAFEREYRRFANLIERIDVKQKQQILAVSMRSHNPFGEEMLREEQANGRAASYVQEQLPSEESIEFLEYQVDEVATRHAQIRAIEQDVQEAAEMFKDLAVMVDEQQVHIDVIDSAIEATKDRTETAMKDIEVAQRHQATARKRACCCLILLLIIVLIIVLVVLFMKDQI